MKILDYFMIALFPISKVLVFEGNSYVCGKNEHGILLKALFLLFYDCKW